MQKEANPVSTLLDRMRRFQTVIEGLSYGLDSQHVMDVIIRSGAAALGAQAGIVALLTPDGKQLKFDASVGYSGDMINAYTKPYPVDSGTALGDCARTGAPIFIRNYQDYRDRWPAYAESYEKAGFRSIVVTPLIFDSKIYGSMAICFREENDFDEQDRVFISALGALCSQAIERARLYEAEKQAREAAEKEQGKLQVSLRSRDDFMSVASHELRTPITSLKIFLQMLYRGSLNQNGEKLSSPGVSNKLLSAIKQVQRLTSLIESMLDVTNIQNHKLQYEFQHVNLTESMLALGARFQEEYRAQGGTLTLDIAAGVSGTLDRLRIEQVITNLLSNAVRFGRHKPVKISLRADLDRAIVTVEDEGVGIAPEHQVKLFEGFEQAFSSQFLGGLGLGLYIARQIVEAHKGTIQVKSVPDQGTTFTVTFPLAH